MGRYRKSMKESLREARLFDVEETTSYPPKEINKKKHDAYKDPKRGEHEVIKKEDDDPSVADVSKGLKIDKKTVKKVMGEKLDALIDESNDLKEIPSRLMTDLKKTFEPLRDKKISVSNSKKLQQIMDKFTDKADLITVFKADIPFVSALAAGRLIQKFGMSGAQINKLKEELEEGYTDARTRAYREHRKKLESTRLRRETKKERIEKESKMSQVKSYIDDIASAMKKDRNMKPFIDRFKKDAEKTQDPEKSLEKVLPDYIPGKDIAKILNMGEEFEEAKLGYGKDIKINPASLKGTDSIRIKATSGMTTTKQVEREVPLQNKQKRLGLNLRRQADGFVVKGRKDSIVQLLKGLEDKFMMGIVNPNSLPYTVHKEEVELDEKMGPIKPRHYDVEVTIKNARDAGAVDEYISDNISMGGIEDYDNDGIITASGYTAGAVNFHGDDAGHIGVDVQKKFRGKVKVVGEAVEIAELKLAVESMYQAEDKRNTEKEFDDMIKDGGIDKKDYEKSKKMYKSGDLTGLRKHIYKLDTAPLEAIMSTIMQNDPKAFKTMYPNAKRGDYMARISYSHRNEEYHTGARGLVEKLTGDELTEINADVIKSLTKKSKASGISLGILKQVFKRGMAAWGGGSRTNMNQHGWSHARVNSFIAKKPGTWGGADKDLAKQAKGS